MYYYILESHEQYQFNHLSEFSQVKVYAQIVLYEQAHWCNLHIYFYPAELLHKFLQKLRSFLTSCSFFLLNMIKYLIRQVGLSKDILVCYFISIYSLSSGRTLHSAARFV